jgi:hypothetical protein
MKACDAEDIINGMHKIRVGKEFPCGSVKETLKMADYAEMPNPHISLGVRYKNGSSMTSCENSNTFMKVKSSLNNNCALYDRILIDLQRCLSISNQSNWDIDRIKRKHFISKSKSEMNLTERRDTNQICHSVVKKGNDGDKVDLLSENSLLIESTQKGTFKSLTKTHTCSVGDKRSLYANHIGKESRSSLLRKSICINGHAFLQQNSVDDVDTRVKELRISDPIKVEIGKNQSLMAFRKVMSGNLIRMHSNRNQNTYNPRIRSVRSLSPTHSKSINYAKFENNETTLDRHMCRSNRDSACASHSNDSTESMSCTSIHVLIQKFDQRLPIATSTGKESRTSFRRKSMDLSSR